MALNPSNSSNLEQLALKGLSILSTAESAEVRCSRANSILVVNG